MHLKSICQFEFQLVKSNLAAHLFLARAIPTSGLPFFITVVTNTTSSTEFSLRSGIGVVDNAWFWSSQVNLWQLKHQARALLRLVWLLCLLSLVNGVPASLRKQNLGLQLSWNSFKTLSHLAPMYFTALLLCMLWLHLRNTIERPDFFSASEGQY